MPLLAVGARHQFSKLWSTVRLGGNYFSSSLHFQMRAALSFDWEVLFLSLQAQVYPGFWPISDRSGLWYFLGAIVPFWGKQHHLQEHSHPSHIFIHRLEVWIVAQWSNRSFHSVNLPAFRGYPSSSDSLSPASDLIHRGIASITYFTKPICYSKSQAPYFFGGVIYQTLAQTLAPLIGLDPQLPFYKLPVYQPMYHEFRPELLKIEFLLLC